jgi:hypothetical protein
MEGGALAHRKAGVLRSLSHRRGRRAIKNQAIHGAARKQCGEPRILPSGGPAERDEAFRYEIGCHYAAPDEAPLYSDVSDRHLCTFLDVRISAETGLGIEPSSADGVGRPASLQPH